VDGVSGPSARDIRLLRLPLVGEVVATSEPGVPFTITDATGVPVDAVSEFMRDFSTSDNSKSSCRSYAHDLLRWWRWLAAIGVQWDQAVRADVRDLVRWLRSAPNPQRIRHRSDAPAPGTVNHRTGKAYLAAGYAPTTINHQLAVLASFYDFYGHYGRGPVISPVPTAAQRHGGRPNAHGNPMVPVVRRHRADYRQRAPDRVPRAVPDDVWNDLFSSLQCHRDRAIFCTYIASGVRASELLGMRCGDVDFGRQTITVVGKGHRERQIVPISQDALVWIRLYLAEGLVAPVGEPLPLDAPLWVTLRRPTRQLTYNAIRRVLQRINDRIDANTTLHDLRHTCAMRMMTDPNLTLADVQTVLRHRSIASTQIYTRVQLDELIARMAEHHARQAVPPPPRANPVYDTSDLDTLFGRPGK
jgi:site-specific recombinase XerD